MSGDKVDVINVVSKVITATNRQNTSRLLVNVKCPQQC